MSRAAVVVVAAVALVVAILVAVFGPSRPGDPSAAAVKRAERLADAIVDSARGAWARERADSQRVLDSLTQATDTARLARAQEQAALALTRRRVSELRATYARLRADSTADRQTVEQAADDVLLACALLDSSAVRHEAALRDDLKRCEHRAGIYQGQRDEAFARLDAAVGALDTLRQRDRANDCRYLFLSGPCPDAVVLGGGEVGTASRAYAGVGLEVGSGRRVAVRSALLASTDGDGVDGQLRVEAVVRLRRVKF